MRQLTIHHALIFVVAFTTLFTNLGGARLWDRDEPRNASCAYEMMQRGDWVTPYFNDELRTHKPVLLYWLMMSAYAAFGVNEFGARFWSAALALGTVLATYHIGRRLFSPTVAFWAAVALCTTLMFDVAGRAATPDSPLIFCTTCAALVYVYGTFRAKPPGHEHLPIEPKQPDCWFPASWPTAALMYALMGAAMLAKGPVGLVLPTACIGMFLLIMRLKPAAANQEQFGWTQRLLRIASPFAPLHFLKTCWVMRPITAIAVSLAVAAPWYVWVGMRTEGEWLEGFFLVHNVQRAAATMDGHDGSVLFYPVAVLVGFFPWSVFAGPLLIDLTARLRRKDPWAPGYIFAACWVAVYMALFTFAQTKLPSYVTPMYPGLALLMGCFLHHWTQEAALVSRLWPRLSFGSLSLVGVAMMIALPIVASRYLPGEQSLALLGLVPVAGAALCIVLTERQRTRWAGAAMAVTATVFCTLLFGYATVRVDRHQHIDKLLSVIDQRGKRSSVVGHGSIEPSWVFYNRHPIRIEPIEAVVEQLSKDEDALVISTTHVYDRLSPALPADVTVLVKAPIFLNDGEWILLGREKPPHTAATTNSRSKTR